MSTATTTATKQPVLPVRVLAELVGTFIVCFITYALTTYVLTLTGNSNNLVLIALGVAAAYALATMLFARYSGAHFNPAITIAALFIGRTKWIDAILYVIAQAVGAIAAGAALIKFLPTSDQLKLSMWLSANGFSTSVNGFGTASPSAYMLQGSGAEFTQTSAIIIELLAAMLVVATAIATMTQTDGKSSGTLQASALALAYGLTTVIAFPITGAAINPVRATGIALFAQGHGLSVEPLSQIWLFWVCSLLAGALVALCIIITRVLATQSNKGAKSKKSKKTQDEKPAAHEASDGDIASDTNAASEPVQEGEGETSHTEPAGAEADDSVDTTTDQETSAEGDASAQDNEQEAK